MYTLASLSLFLHSNENINAGEARVAVIQAENKLQNAFLFCPWLGQAFTLKMKSATRKNRQLLKIALNFRKRNLARSTLTYVYPYATNTSIQFNLVQRFGWFLSSPCILISNLKYLYTTNKYALGKTHEFHSHSSHSRFSCCWLVFFFFLQLLVFARDFFFYFACQPFLFPFSFIRLVMKIK